LPMFHEFNALYGDDWVQWHQSNGPMRLNASYLVANPAHPAVAQRIVDVSKDILSHYAVDGLHFDYIRYEDRPYSYDPLSNQAYAAALATEPGLTRAEWQRRQVTGLLERIKSEALPLRPGAHLTATAWPVYIDRWDWFHGYDGFSARYQDSQPWAHNGVVSAIMPMIYGPSFTSYSDRFEILAHDFVSGAQPGGAILGITADYASFTDLAWRIEVSRAAGAWGEALFSYGALNTRDYWNELRNGPYRRIAVPNWP
jgi:uncharacterized lipoprotein YddW (UPF0748 family)